MSETTKRDDDLKQIIYAEESYQIIGASMEVYNAMKSGFPEGVYQESLEIEFTEQGIPFVPQQEIHVRYKGKLLKKTFKADFVAFGKIIIEIKAIEHLTDEAVAQALHYLKATGYKLAILINFGNPKKLEYRRIVA